MSDKKVDESWKQQAQTEKEKVAAETPRQPLPAPTIGTLINGLATQTMLSLGFMAEEEGKEPKIDLVAARYSIDLLDVLAEKTKGNLSAEESKYLTGVLHELRMGFVTQSKKKA